MSCSLALDQQTPLKEKNQTQNTYIIIIIINDKFKIKTLEKLKIIQFLFQ